MRLRLQTATKKNVNELTLTTKNEMQIGVVNLLMESNLCMARNATNTPKKHTKVKRKEKKNGRRRRQTAKEQNDDANATKSV